jgi:hypothetical protein
MKPKRVALSLVSVLAVSLAGCATEQEQRGLIDATALEMIPADEVEPVEIVREHNPHVYWIMAMHRPTPDYPRASRALRERIGTALTNGNRFVRRVKPLARQAALMRKHRHADWIGEYDDLSIVSAPSSVEHLTIVAAPSPEVEAADDLTTSFYIRTLAIDPGGPLRLLRPVKVVLPGDGGIEEDDGTFLSLIRQDLAESDTGRIVRRTPGLRRLYERCGRCFRRSDRR